MPASLWSWAARISSPSAKAGITEARTFLAMGSISSSCCALTPPPMRMSCGLKICTMPARPWAISSVQSSRSARMVGSPAWADSKIARPSFHFGFRGCAPRTRAVVAAYRSQQPDAPQVQSTPSSAWVRKCPSSPPRPRAPSSRRPPVRMPPPTPVPSVTPMTSV